MAEAIARYDAADVIEASSAGLSPMGSIAEQTKETLILNGYSADGLTSGRKSRTGSCRIRTAARQRRIREYSRASSGASISWLWA